MKKFFINNEIRKESEYLNSLFNQKYNIFMSQINLNNNNINPIMFQQNLMMNSPPINMNINQIQMEQPRIIQSNLNYLEPVHDNVIIIFNTDSGISTSLECKSNDRLCDIIIKYKEKVKLYDENIFFIFNAKKLDDKSTFTIAQTGISYGSVITVRQLGILKAGKN